MTTDYKSPIPLMVKDWIEINDETIKGFLPAFISGYTQWRLTNVTESLIEIYNHFKGRYATIPKGNVLYISETDRTLGNLYELKYCDPKKYKLIKEEPMNQECEHKIRFTEGKVFINDVEYVPKEPKKGPFYPKTLAEFEEKYQYALGKEKIDNLKKVGCYQYADIELLRQLRDCYNGPDFKPTWGSKMYGIEIDPISGKAQKCLIYLICNFLYFKEEKARDLFLENFRELIENTGIETL